ncbi:hypothetical protein Tco_0763203 [Tanacetum coccineum]
MDILGRKHLYLPLCLLFTKLVRVKDRETIRQEVKIPQSNFPTHTLIADEVAFTGVDVVHGGAATIVSSIDAGHGSGNITKSPTMPHDLPLPRGHTLGSDEGKDLVAEDPSKQGRSMIEEMDLDARISLVHPHVEVQGRYGHNLDTQEDTTIDDLTFTETLMEIRKSDAKAKGKAKMDETESPRRMKQRDLVQISRDAEVAQKLQEEFDAAKTQRMTQVHQAAQGFTDSKWDNVLARVAADEDFVQQLQAGEKCSEEDLPMKLVELVNQRKKFFAQQRAEAKRNKPMTPAQQKEYMSNYIKNQEGGYSIKQLKSLSFEQVKEIFETTMRKVQSFVPMGSELEVQRLKRAGQEVLEEPVKRQKIGEASGSGEESAEKEKELSEEELQKLLVIVPVEEVYVEALQVKYPIIDWEVYSEDTRRTTEPIDDKEKKLWVELKRLFKPDNDDTLWKLQRDQHELNTAKLALMANLSHYGSDALAEINNQDNMDNYMINQAVQAMPSFEQSSVVNNSETKITSDSNIIPYSQYVTESQQAVVQNSNSSAQQDALILSAVEQHRLELKTFEVKMNQVLNENERLLKQVINKDIVDIIRNSSVNVHECEMCLKFETELLNKKDFTEKETYDKLFRSFTTLEKHCISLEVNTQLNQEIFQRDNSVSNQSAPTFDQYFELNELKA